MRRQRGKRCQAKNKPKKKRLRAASRTQQAATKRQLGQAAMSRLPDDVEDFDLFLLGLEEDKREFIAKVAMQECTQCAAIQSLQGRFDRKCPSCAANDSEPHGRMNMSRLSSNFTRLFKRGLSLHGSSLSDVRCQIYGLDTNIRRHGCGSDSMPSMPRVDIDETEHGFREAGWGAYAAPEPKKRKRVTKKQASDAPCCVPPPDVKPSKEWDGCCKMCADFIDVRGHCACRESWW